MENSYRNRSYGQTRKKKTPTKQTNRKKLFCYYKYVNSVRMRKHKTIHLQKKINNDI